MKINIKGEDRPDGDALYKSVEEILQPSERDILKRLEIGVELHNITR